MKIILDLPDDNLEDIKRDMDFRNIDYYITILSSNYVIVDIEKPGVLAIPARAEGFEDDIKELLVDYCATGRIESSLTGNTTTTSADRQFTQPPVQIVVSSSDGRMDNMSEEHREATVPISELRKIRFEAAKYRKELQSLTARLDEELRKSELTNTNQIEQLRQQSRELTLQGEIVDATKLFNLAWEMEYGTKPITDVSNNQFTLLAAQIVDTVCDAIYNEHPDLADQMIEKYTEDIEDPSIISGDAYYALEDKVVKLLSE